MASPLPPGSTIGILGAGQLGRMLAMAAARLGLKSHVYSDTPGPAFDVAAECTIGAYEDLAAVRAFAGRVGVVTYEFENVPVETASAALEVCPVRPNPRALEVAQDRLAEKTFLQGLGLPVAPFAAVGSVAELEAAMARMAAPAILKTRRLGYDGKGQVSVAPGSDLAAAFAAIGTSPAVLERRLAFKSEFSVLLVRGHGAGGSEVACYDVPHNEHRDGILHRSSVPSGLASSVLEPAVAAARRMAEALDYVGVLAVEMFDLGSGAEQPIVVNELAPRVHNSGHWTLDACAVSQFENHIRAVAGWPLGSVARHSDAVMTNLIGAEALDWQYLARTKNGPTCLHLYGKHDARPGRKMGHITELRALRGGR